MALVNNYEIEELGLEFPEWFAAVVSGQLVVEAHIYLIRTVEFPVLYFCHYFFERPEILLHSLVDKYVAVRKV